MSRRSKLRMVRERYEAWCYEAPEPRCFRTKAALMRWAQGQDLVQVRTIRPRSIRGKVYEVSSFWRVERGAITARGGNGWDDVHGMGR